MDRRGFLKRTSAAATLSCFPGMLSAIEREKPPSGLERRALGRTGEKLSLLGFGGIVVMNATTEQATQRVKDAIDRGINYFDVAPTYGNAEDMLGPALEPHRKKVFLACKTTERSKSGAAAELERLGLGRAAARERIHHQLRAMAEFAPFVELAIAVRRHPQAQERRK